jgi:hypothetical protein
MFRLLSIPTPHSVITRNDAIKLIFVKLFSVSQNVHCDTEVEKEIFGQPYAKQAANFF